MIINQHKICFKCLIKIIDCFAHSTEVMPFPPLRIFHSVTWSGLVKDTKIHKTFVKFAPEGKSPRTCRGESTMRGLALWLRVCLQRVWIIQPFPSSFFILRSAIHIAFSGSAWWHWGVGGIMSHRKETSVSLFPNYPYLFLPESLNPLAKGFRSIFNLVIWKQTKKHELYLY